MHTHLAVLGMMHIVDLIDHWQPPATELLTSSAALREVVEWSQGHNQIRVQPFQVRDTDALSCNPQANRLRQSYPDGSLKYQSSSYSMHFVISRE
jgi:hypothetical protein